MKNQLWLLTIALSLSAQTYKLQTPTGIVNIPTESYVAGVITGESSTFRSEEALKAMAVAARTYAANTKGRHANQGFDFCSTTHCQRYVPASARASNAVQSTAGEFLWFNGKPAFTVYSRSCGGKTENVNAVWPNIQAPYLISHADPYCARTWNWFASPTQISHSLKQAGLKVPEHLNSISVVRRTNSGRAQTLSLAGDDHGELVSASSFHFAIGRSIGWHAIRSEQYNIENAGNEIIFRGSGEGHGVGLCQTGADQMGLAGKTYREILGFYYPGTTFQPGNLHWTRLAGENVMLFTLRPDEDRPLISIAESILKRWPISALIDLYVYPDLDSFRNATGEPGWVAARTSGTKIEMQPSGILRRHHALSSTLEHEIVHCFVESSAKPGLPVWFREGLVEVLTKHRPTPVTNTPNDTDLRQRQNRQTAEAGYEGAQSQVQALVDRYGETTVVGWLKRGLPADVKYSKISNPNVNNK